MSKTRNSAKAQIRETVAAVPKPWGYEGPTGPRGEFVKV